jgi:DNA-binding NarL/FixJ family response regulator
MMPLAEEGAKVGNGMLITDFFNPNLKEDPLFLQFRDVLEKIVSDKAPVLYKDSNDFRSEQAVKTICPHLSNRENDVLICIAKGLTQKETARVLNLSPTTIGSYKKDIYRKLGISSIAEATLEAIKYNLIGTNYS